MTGGLSWFLPDDRDGAGAALAAEGGGLTRAAREAFALAPPTPGRRYSGTATTQVQEIDLSAVSVFGERWPGRFIGFQCQARAYVVASEAPLSSAEQAAAAAGSRSEDVPADTSRVLGLFRAERYLYVVAASSARFTLSLLTREER